MHFATLVILPEGVSPKHRGDVEVAINELLAPYCEETPDGEYNEKNGKWDWYQIGGRYTGRLTGYDPAKDPRNWETCDLCRGTPGFRNDPLGKEHRERDPEYGCNGCSGHLEITKKPGIRVKWPTQFVPYDGDFAVLTEDLAKTAREKVYSVLVDGTWTDREKWNGNGFDSVELPDLTPFVGRTWVMVDRHS